MTGSGWNGRRRVPGDWKTRRATVIRRAQDQCEAIVNGVRCTLEAIEVDHIVPIAEGGSHELDNLAAICGAHHAAKTKAESARGRARWLASRRQTRRREAEAHPGRIQRHA